MLYPVTSAVGSIIVIGMLSVMLIFLKMVIGDNGNSASAFGRSSTTTVSQGLVFRDKVSRSRSSYAQDTAVIQQKELVKMVSPSPEALSSINEWMTRTSMGSVYLIGEDRHLWKTTERLELLALDRSGCDDLLSAWMTNSATTWFHWAVGRYFKAGCHAVSGTALLI